MWEASIVSYNMKFITLWQIDYNSECSLNTDKSKISSFCKQDSRPFFLNILEQYYTPVSQWTNIAFMKDH